MLPLVLGVALAFATQTPRGVDATLVERTFPRVVRADCLAPTTAQVWLRPRAAFAVIDRVSGIEPMELLRGRDLLAQPARGVSHDAIRARAAALLATVSIDGGVTDTMRQERLEDVISRLDKQPPELAAKTASALLAAGDEVVPLLQTRLRQTDRCRGLALIAGILAGRNAAEADVEAAFSRVLVGKCQGREPFDLQLAQSVASAFTKRPDGIAKVTTLLADRDVVVRRRAAEAFAGLFERLGQGEHSQAEPADPAILAAARAALEPLVTLAQTERDQQARCQAVRALQRAQEAADAPLRDAAAAATTGRTLRCLASPDR